MTDFIGAVLAILLISLIALPIPAAIYLMIRSSK